MELPEKMHLLRDSFDLNQTEFGELVGLKQGSLADIERGRTKTLSESVKIILSVIYKVNVKWLESDSDDITQMYLDNSIVSEPQESYHTCKKCLEKDKRIIELEGILKTINKLSSKKYNYE